MTRIESPQLDSYTVLSVVGTGGMATVYKVRYDPLGSFRALKVLSNPNPEVARRLRLEGRVQAQLKHPNVVQVYDVVLVDGQPGLVMEYVAGPTLKQLIAGQTVPLAEVAQLGAGILRGVAAAHAAGCLHRDLKPGNVLLEILDDRLVPKVADFGLAKVLQEARVDGLDPSSPHTPTGAVVGTWRYMAPEQVHRQPTDTRTDVFALGSLLYELATGHAAFDSTSIATCTHRIANADTLDVLQLRPDLPPDLAAAIRAALQVEPDDRPDDAGALLGLWRAADLDHRPFSASTLHRARSEPAGADESSTATFLPTATSQPMAAPLPSATPTSVTLEPRRGGIVSWVSAVLVIGAIGAIGAAGWWLTSTTPTQPPSAAPPLPVVVGISGGDAALPPLRAALERLPDGAALSTAPAVRASELALGADAAVLAVLPPSAITDPSAWVVVAETVREGWLVTDGAWLLAPAPLEAAELDGGTVCTLEDHAPEVFTAWLAAGSASAVRTTPIGPDLTGCDALVSGRHGQRERLEARVPAWAVAQITGPPAVLMVAPSAYDRAVEPARSALTALSSEVFGDDVVAVRLARGPLTLPALELTWTDPGRPAPEPTAPAPPTPIPTATVRVRTIGGPAGTYTIDSSPPTPTGWRTPTVVPAGLHDLRVFPGGSSEAAFQQMLELKPDEEVRICVDLSTGAPC